MLLIPSLSLSLNLFFPQPQTSDSPWTFQCLLKPKPVSLSRGRFRCVLLTYEHITTQQKAEDLEAVPDSQENWSSALIIEKKPSRGLIADVHSVPMTILLRASHVHGTYSSMWLFMCLDRWLCSTNVNQGSTPFLKDLDFILHLLSKRKTTPSHLPTSSLFNYLILLPFLLLRFTPAGDRG